MVWDQTIYFGMGKQRPHGGLTGFHRNGSQGVFSGILFRGESNKRPPPIIFANGFELRITGDVHGRVASDIPGVDNEHGTTRGCLSFGLQTIIAAHWAAENDQKEGWCYCIYLENEPWAAEGNRNMTSEAGKWSMNYQGEILLRPSGGMRLTPDHIWGARKSVRASQSYRKGTGNIRRYDRDGKLTTVRGTTWRKGSDELGELTLVGPVVQNPGYRGPDLAIAGAMDPEFQVFRGTRPFILPPV